MNKKIKGGIIFILGFILLIIFLIVVLEITRSLSYEQIDDVHPLINCDTNYIEKSDVLMVIPLYNNDSIANYPEWCKKILDYNKTVGMHGVYHTYDEFLDEISEEELKSAIDEFEKCFNKSPKLFEPPQWDISKNNEKLVEKYIPVVSRFQGIFHKVYHCEENGNFRYNFLGIRVTNSRISKS